MKKLLFLLFSLFISSNLFSQSKHSFDQWKDDVNIEKPCVDSLEFKNAVNKNLYLAGAYVQRSAAYEYCSIGSAILSGGLITLGSSIKKGSDNTDKTSCYVVGAAFGVTSIACYFISLNYKLKSGKSLKLSASGLGGKISYKF